MRLADGMVVGLAATIALRAEGTKALKIVDFICAIFPVYPSDTRK
jgi:hypothetical protein